MRILSIDVGMGTQDVYLYNSSKNPENCIKIILPSRTAVLHDMIGEANSARREIFFTGELMGGGPSVKALKKHIASGLKAYATKQAAMTFNDNPDRVREMGVQIVSEDDVPEGARRIYTMDIDMDFISCILEGVNETVPENIAVAVQDHGYSPDVSNRIFRFECFKEALIRGKGDLDGFAYLNEVPPYYTRMQAVLRTVRTHAPNASIMLMDTSMAAIRGCLVRHEDDMPFIALNVGNAHTIAAVIDGGNMVGLFEDHTRNMTPERFRDYLRRLADGTLTFEEVFDGGGHGAHIMSAPGWENIKTVVITGPNRERALEAEIEANVSAPAGDPMITGCYGIIEEMKRKIGE